MASPNPWDPAPAPNGAGLLLSHFVASGIVTQKNLEIELLKLAKDTADIVHPFFLAQKCQTLQSMNNHLEAVLKEKRSLRQRLLKPMCQENLPIEAVYHTKAFAKMDILVTETEELVENILKWRKQQNEVSSYIPKILAEENYLHKHDIIMPPLPFTSTVPIQTIIAK
uniref:HAUS augmin like complex subunit 2 n=1 Tax=Propithecus coquereli TaxID=379532 RepID=A0A2K6G6U4_PROCO